MLHKRFIYSLVLASMFTFTGVCNADSSELHFINAYDKKIIVHYTLWDDNREREGTLEINPHSEYMEQFLDIDIKKFNIQIKYEILVKAKSILNNFARNAQLEIPVSVAEIITKYTPSASSPSASDSFMCYFNNNYIGAVKEYKNREELEKRNTVKFSLEEGITFSGDSKEQEGCMIM